MSYDPALTERAARILAERGPEDRLDAFKMLAGQDDLWRRPRPGTDGPGADFAEAVRLHEAETGRVLARQTRPPGFGVVRYRRSERTREVAVWLGGRMLGWIVARGRGRRTDPVWSLADLPIVLGRSYPEMCGEPLRPLAGAERRVAELAYVHLVEPGAGEAA